MRKLIHRIIGFSLVGISTFLIFLAGLNILHLVFLEDCDRPLTKTEMYGEETLIEENTIGKLICKVDKSICVQLSNDGKFLYFIYEGRIIQDGGWEV